jgi:alpha-glucosidase
VWTGSNHDVSRLATRWGGGDPDKIRVALLILLSLRGTVVLYQGDEIGLTDGDITVEELEDPVGRRFWPAYPGRDPERTPMPWSDEPGRGFTAPGVTPWLRMATPPECNVAAQEDDPSSVLSFVRDAVALRRATPALQLGDYRSLETPDGVWAWRRGEHTVVAVNLSDAPVEVPGLAGTVVFATLPELGGANAGDGLVLSPWSGVVLAN